MKTLRIWLVAVLTIRAVGGIASGQSLVTGEMTAAALKQRDAIASGHYVRVGRGLAPCDPQSARPVTIERPATRFWAGVFAIDDTGQGAWQIAIEDIQSGRRFTYPITPALSGRSIETQLIPTNGVRIVLEGPGVAEVRCPEVRFESELQAIEKGQARGVFDRDERWTELSGELRDQVDGDMVRGWSRSVFELLAVGSRRELLPCTGFFISPHVLMTAHHCVAAQEELDRGLLFLPAGPMEGKNLRLFMVNGALDFSLIWVENAAGIKPLPLGAADGGRGFIWQFPVGLQKQVSLKGCSIDSVRASQLVHRCDTSVGASGSPIQLREGGEVIGLHTDGCAGIANGTSWCENFGTRMSEIRALIVSVSKHLQSRHPQIATELLPLIAAPPAP